MWCIESLLGICGGMGTAALQGLGRTASPWAGEEQRGLPGTALGAEFCLQNFFLGPVDCGGFILLLNEPSLLQLLFLGDPSMSKSRYFPPHAQTP